jgi:hypothetical protein
VAAVAAAYVEMVGQFVPPAFGEGAGYGLARLR